MDGVVKHKKVTVELPTVPIKTYQWEDLRRARRRGGYPWTYLDKEAFDEEVDPEEFTMEGFKKSKSASTLGKNSEGVTIEDVTDAEMEKENRKPNEEVVEKDERNDGSVEFAESSGDDNISQYLDKDEKEKEIEEIPVAGTSKNVTQIEDDEEEQMEERKRARSEEPKRKRKHSVESSYSRISMSRLGMMKRLKEAKDKLEKIKMPSLPKMPKLPKIPSFKKSSKTDQEKPKKEKEEVKKDVKKIETKKEEKPVYIHIPLKPPPGETDEFSKFAMEIEEKVEGNEKEIKEEPEPETPSSPDSPGKSGVQLIILTAPSDDEILDGPDIPETPSDTDPKGFYKDRFEELKNLAKDIVEEISPSREQTPAKEIPAEEGTTQGEIKEEIAEEPKEEKPEEEKPKEEKSNEEKSKEEKPKEEKSKEETKGKRKKVVKKKAPEVANKEVENKTDDEKVQSQQDDPSKMLVDEEDGLKLSEPTTASAVTEEKQEPPKEDVDKTEGEKKEEEKEKEPELQSIIKTEPSPKPKKKVSFRRKTKADGDYEDVIPKDDDAKNTLEATQSMSVDEEKSYLDEKKIMKDTSLEDDYNKWSKLADHEYEPINPPLEETLAPTSQGDEGNQNAQEEFISVQEMQNRMEDQFFNQSASKKSTPSAGAGKAKFASIIKAAKAQADTTKPKASILKPSPSQPSTSTKPEEPEKEETQTTKEKLQGQGRRIKAAFNTQAGRFKTRMQNIKKPTLSTGTKAKLAKLKPKKPDMSKLKKPNISMPKMPEKMAFPSFTLTKKGTANRNLKARQYSTESNAGDSKKKLFDFSTVPRMFSRQKKDDIDDDLEDKPVESSTVPRTKKASAKWAQKLNELKAKAAELEVAKKLKKDDTKKAETTRKAKESEGRTQAKPVSPVYIRIPLHSQESMDREEGIVRDEPSQIRYNPDIDVDEAFDKENREIHKVSQFSSSFKQNDRWSHGTFHPEGDGSKEDQPSDEPREYGRQDFKVTDLDNGNSESLSPERSRYDSPNIHSSSSFGDIHRRGVLEEINSDEFFLRQKGISQDNIEVGAYLSSEIREAFKDPINSLQQMQYDDSFDREGDINISDLSVEGSPKRKPIRKPKRKKTPTVSREKLSFDQESATEPEEYPKPEPSRPRRRSKKKKKVDDVVPYQETIQVEDPGFHEELHSELMEENILREDLPQMYENEQMRGIEQPEIMVSDTYHRDFLKNVDVGYIDDDSNGLPSAPPRKQRSLRSLNASEQDSITGEFQSDFRDMQLHNPQLYHSEQDYIIPTGDEEAPIAPRRNRSRTRSQSRATSQPDEDQVSRSESFMYENQQPCVEEPCVSDLRDCMGYAVIDKKQVYREPPLPPCRTPPTPPRRRKAKVKKDTKKTEERFFTVPRPLKDEAPMRPLRNYSTLGSSEIKKKPVPNLTDEEKENIDITQYIEIEEPNRDLQSGEVIQKMRDRPLPPPPRPPRKPRDGSRPLSDITNGQILEESDMVLPEETEVSTQTEPLPDDFVCEELIQEKTDRVVTPTLQRSFDNEETITHGALIIERLEAEIIPDFPREENKYENTIPITKDYDDDEETSEIPEEFHLLKSPTEVPDVQEEKPPERVPRRKGSLKPEHQQETPQAQVIERIIERQVPVHVQPDSTTEVELLRASKLQVGDLDVNRLTVNELLASKIKVSDIESGTIQVSEINSQGGNLVVSGIELPASFIKELLEKLQEQAGREAVPKGEGEPSGQKKTPIEVREEVLEAVPERPPRRKSEIDLDKLEEFEPREETTSQLEETSTTVEELQKIDGTTPPNEEVEPIMGETSQSVEETSKLLEKTSGSVEDPATPTQETSLSVEETEPSVQETVLLGEEIVPSVEETTLSVEEIPQKTEEAISEEISLQVEETTHSPNEESLLQQELPGEHPTALSSNVLEEIELENPYEEIKGEESNDNLLEVQPERPPRQKSGKNLDISSENLVSLEELRLELPPELPQQEEIDIELTPRVVEAAEGTEKPLLQRMESEFEIENEDALLEHLRNKHFLQRGFFSEDYSDMPGLEDEIVEIEPEFREVPIEEEIPLTPPVRPSRKKSITEQQLADLEDQILRNLEDDIEVAPDVPERPMLQSELYNLDPKILKEIETEFVKEMQQMQERKPSESEENQQEKSEDVDTSEEPPPRPPHPQEMHPDLGYIPSQPPPSFYDLRSPVFIDLVDEEDIPLPPHRRRRAKPVPSASSSEELVTTRRRQRTPEPTIPQLAGQLTRACGTAIDRSLKRLIMHITNNVMANSDGRQDLHVIIVMLLVLIAGLILLGFGDGRNIHHHHWEYFNPPKDL